MDNLVFDTPVVVMIIMILMVLSLNFLDNGELHGHVAIIKTISLIIVVVILLFFSLILDLLERFHKG